MKSQINKFIDNYNKEITDMADYIFDNPELGGKEYKAYSVLTESLSNQGFHVEHHVGGLETAFKAVFSQGNGGPTIGLLCEYDALEGIGHACGHHMQGPSIIYAALAIKETVKSLNYTLVVYGTPAEETFGGKIEMINNGCFEELDVALMMHASPITTTDVKSMAMSKFLVEFHGSSAHAALKPEEGRSALDGVMMLSNGVEYMREHVRDDVRIHYSIVNGGGPSNVVPKYASAEYVLRSYNREYLNQVVERFEKIVQGAALITETDYTLTLKKSLDNKIPVLRLNELLMENAELLEAPRVRPAREKTGSTDFGNVMYNIPGSCIRIAFVPEGTSSHSDEYLRAGKTKEAHDATILAAKILGYSIFDIIKNKELLEEIEMEFTKNKAIS